MKSSFQNKALAFVIAVLLVIGMSPAVSAKRATAKIKIEKINVKLAVGESVLLTVDYTELEELEDDDAVDLYKARVYVDKFEVADADFGSDGADIETLEITGLADGETSVVIRVGRFYSQCNVTVGKGAKSPEQAKKEAAATKTEQDAIKNDNSELGAALAEAIKGTTKKEVVVPTTSAKTPSISPATMKGLAARAKQAKKNALVRLDSVDSNGKVQARMLLNPEGLTNLKSDFKTGITIDTSRKASLGSKYIASVKCAHTGNLGMFTEIGVKVSVPKDLSQLSLYNVDSKGKLVKIEEPSCSVDKNGLLWFYTKSAGEIVIMNG